MAWDTSHSAVYHAASPAGRRSLCTCVVHICVRSPSWRSLRGWLFSVQPAFSLFGMRPRRAACRSPRSACSPAPSRSPPCGRWPLPRVPPAASPPSPTSMPRPPRRATAEQQLRRSRAHPLRRHYAENFPFSLIRTPCRWCCPSVTTRCRHRSSPTASPWCRRSRWCRAVMLWAWVHLWGRCPPGSY
jgi:hypothetical protein